MKKLIAMLLTAMCAVSVSLAQETVTGVVVDKKGNPLPGVRIEVPGTPDHAISDLDGSFTLFRSDQSKKKLYATYAGMNPRKVKIKEGMRIKMSEYNWWTQKPDEWNWMVNAIFALPNVHGDVINPAYGLMLGRVKKFGYYVKGITNTFGVSDKGKWNDVGSGFIDSQKSTYWSVTGGAMVRLGCPIHFYLGLGYADYSYYVKNTSGNTFLYDDLTKRNLVADLGFMLRIKRVNISLGITTGEVFGYDQTGAGNFGIGYSF